MVRVPFFWSEIIKPILEIHFEVKESEKHICNHIFIVLFAIPELSCSTYLDCDSHGKSHPLTDPPMSNKNRMRGPSALPEISRRHLKIHLHATWGKLLGACYPEMDTRGLAFIPGCFPGTLGWPIANSRPLVYNRVIIPNPSENPFLTIYLNCWMDKYCRTDICFSLW